jgi:hypothetical protein
MGAALESQDAESAHYAHPGEEVLPGFVLQWAPERAGECEERQHNDQRASNGRCAQTDNELDMHVNLAQTDNELHMHVNLEGSSSMSAAFFVAQRAIHQKAAPLTCDTRDTRCERTRAAFTAHRHAAPNR